MNRPESIDKADIPVSGFNPSFLIDPLHEHPAMEIEAVNAEAHLKEQGLDSFLTYNGLDADDIAQTLETDDASVALPKVY